MSSVVAPTKSNTIDILLGAVKQTSRLICLDWKPNRVNYILTASNAWTAKAIIKPTLMFVPFGDIVSIRISIQKVLRVLQ